MSCGGECGCAAGEVSGKEDAVRGSPGGTARARRARAGGSSSPSGSPRGRPERPRRIFRVRVRAGRAAPPRTAAGRRARSPVTALVALDRSGPSSSSSDSLPCSTAAISTRSPITSQTKSGDGTESEGGVADAVVCRGAIGPGFARPMGAGSTSAQVRIQTHARHTSGVDRSTSASGDTGAKCEGRLDNTLSHSRGVCSTRVDGVRRGGPQPAIASGFAAPRFFGTSANAAPARLFRCDRREPGLR